MSRWLDLLLARRFRISVYYILGLPLFAFSVLAALAIGGTHVDAHVVARILAAHLTPAGWVDLSQVDPADNIIVWLMRLPRVLVAALVGAALAAAGVVMQALFRNPLAEPGLTGAGAGAALGAVIAFVAGWTTHSVLMLPLMAMIGALGALALVYGLATRGGVSPVTTLLLAGVAVSSLLGAVSSLLLSLNIVDWQVAQEIVFWMMGGLDARTWTHVWLSAPFVLLGVAAAMAMGRDLDLLQQGEQTATSLGVNVEATKRLLLLAAAMLTGAAISVAGMIGFVGLIVPHAVRLIVGPSNRTLLPASALSGAIFVIFADLIARTAHPPIEIRLGVVTALAGAPFFLWMLARNMRREGGEQ